MVKIMFVCHGNICRSPMAEFIFKDMLKDRGLENNFLVQSSATSSEEIWMGIGNPVYPPAKEELKKHGIYCDNKRAVQLKREDYENYDLFIVMDSYNLKNVLRIFGQDRENKVKKLMDYTTKKGDVADPWYTDRFDITYKDIFEGCSALLENLLNKKVY